MRQTMQRIGMSAYATLLAAFAAALIGGSPAAAQDGQTDEIFLIRQDSADCRNDGVNANDPSLIGGTMWLSRTTDGTTAVKIAVTMQPRTTYHLFLKCVRLLGDVTTGDEGTAIVSFSFPTKEVGNVFAFDMYPQGAPAGNKYQSTQVVFK